jgi:tetratricopeptide (TPR) repeat protein
MKEIPFRVFAACCAAFLCGCFGFSALPASGQAPAGNSSSSSSASAPANAPGPQGYVQERTPTMIDPAGPTISLINSEQVFAVAAALNACGYDEGLADSADVRKRIRDEVNQALAKSEQARAARDAVCLFIDQHRMTGGSRDISQYISLALYLTPPPELEMTAELTEMPPDATQVAEIVPLLRTFAAATDLHGIWLTVRLTYDDESGKIHDALSQMIVDTNLYLKTPASTYTGSRFIVIVEPLLSPGMVNARIYGVDYVVVVSPVKGTIPMKDVRHTYLHYVIDPLLYARSNAIDREQPILREIRDAPLEFRYRSDVVPLTIECLIKAIEARTMDTGVQIYKIPTNVERSELPRYEHERQITLDKAEAVRKATVQHDMNQGFVLTQYFYDQLLPFEKDPASLKDTIGEMVYTMDVDQQVHRTRNTTFDAQADEDVLQHSAPHKLSGLDLAEARLSNGDTKAASEMAQKVLAHQDDTTQSAADAARAHFILARVDLMSVHPNETEDEAEKTVNDAIDQFNKTLASSKDQRLLAWSHIYLGRVLDLECKRDEAVSEYNSALAVRDGQLDTRLAAERGAKAAYVTPGHHSQCEDSSEDAPPAADNPPAGQEKPANGPGNSQTGAQKPQ